MNQPPEFMSLIGKVCVALAATAVLYGCAAYSRGAAFPRIPFPAEEYALLKTSGNSTVSGDAVLDQFKVDECRPSNPVHHVFLLPVTSYSKQAELIAWQRNNLIADPDPRQEPYVRRLPPVANGSFEAKFEFKNVPPGEYYAVDNSQFDVVCNTPDGKGRRSRYTKITVVEHQNLTGVQIRPPSGPQGGSLSFQ